MTMPVPYDKLDNDTYTDVLGATPRDDVLLHMFRDPNGKVTRTAQDGSTVTGNFNSESETTARDHVLQFASTKVTGLKIIKTLMLNSLLPMSLVHRHGLCAEKLVHSQQTPIFYDTKNEKFVVLLDKRFLRDMDFIELKVDQELFDRFRKCVEAYPHNAVAGETRNVGLQFDTIEEIRNSFNKDVPDSPFGMAKALYRQYRLLQSAGEKVIVIKGLTKFQEEAQLIQGIRGDCSTHAMNTSAYYLEFLVAYRFGRQYYLAKANGELDQSKSFHLDKANHQNPQDRSFRLAESESNLLVVPFSDTQIAMLTMLAGKLNAFHDEVMSFLKSSEQKTEVLDAPLGSVQPQGLLQQLMGQQN
jgi:hypothetical protein